MVEPLVGAVKVMVRVKTFIVSVFLLACGEALAAEEFESANCRLQLTALSDDTAYAMEQSLEPMFLAIYQGRSAEFEGYFKKIRTSYSAGALARFPLLLPSMFLSLSFPVKSLIQFIHWLQLMERHFLENELPERLAERNENRIFEVLENLNIMRAVLTTNDIKEVVVALDEFSFDVEGVDVRFWLGDRYRRWKAEFFKGDSKPKHVHLQSNSWKTLKFDLFDSLDQHQVVFARFFFSVFYAGLEMAEMETSWRFSPFVDLSRSPRFGEIGPFVFDEISYAIFQDVFEKMLDDEEPAAEESEFTELAPTNFQTLPEVEYDPKATAYFYRQEELMLQIMDYVAMQGKDPEHPIEPDEVVDILNDFDLADETLNQPMSVEDGLDQLDAELGQLMTIHQALHFWHLSHEAAAPILGRLGSAHLPVWLIPPIFSSENSSAR